MYMPVILAFMLASNARREIPGTISLRSSKRLGIRRQSSITQLYFRRAALTSYQFQAYRVTTRVKPLVSLWSNCLHMAPDCFPQPPKHRSLTIQVRLPYSWIVQGCRGDGHQAAGHNGWVG